MRTSARRFSQEMNEENPWSEHGRRGALYGITAGDALGGDQRIPSAMRSLQSGFRW